MKTAFVLSGGGSLGAIQVGMLRALVDADIQPDLIVGTSVGAINGAYVAGAASLEGLAGLEAIWRGLRRNDVFPVGAFDGLRALTGRNNHIASSKGLRRLLHNNLSFERLEESPIPLHVIATDTASGKEVRLSSGDAVSAVLASSAIPGVFSPVQIGTRHLIDGGVTNNTPISHAVDLGADLVYVLSTGFACALPRPPSNAIGVMIQALTLLVQTRLAIDVQAYEERVDLRLVPTICPLDVSPADFSSGGHLIEIARESTGNWIAEGRPQRGQAHRLELHSHVPQSGGADA